MFQDSMSGAAGVDLQFSDAAVTGAERASPEVRARILLNVLPASVRIGPHDFRIVRASNFENTGTFGHVDGKAQEIRIWPHSSPTNLVDTFLHECLHVMWKQAGLGEKNDEETVVAVYGCAVTALHRDNPWLAGWIGGAVQ